MSKLNVWTDDLLRKASRERKKKVKDNLIFCEKTFASSLIRNAETSAHQDALQVATLPSHYSKSQKFFVRSSEAQYQTLMLKYLEKIHSWLTPHKSSHIAITWNATFCNQNN